MSNIHKNFNSRTRVGATPGGCGAGIFTRFQFTHPCGCDQPYAGVWGNPDVSIHAPVWVRPGPYSHHKTHKGFNSRTRVGATAVPTPSRRARTGFNSRTRVGATRPQDGRCFVRTVSIHAPVWVRRGAAESRRLHIPSFNSRTRVGATSPPLNPILKQWFQFTHPCGCDPCPGECTCTPLSFNSRTRVGATLRFGHVPTMAQSFNSRTRVGATRGRRKQETPYTEFQFTHPCGCDCVYTYLHCPHQVSIHAPVWVRRTEK